MDVPYLFPHLEDVERFDITQNRWDQWIFLRQNGTVLDGGCWGSPWTTKPSNWNSATRCAQQRWRSEDVTRVTVALLKWDIFGKDWKGHPWMFYFSGFMMFYGLDLFGMSANVHFLYKLSNETLRFCCCETFFVTDSPAGGRKGRRGGRAERHFPRRGRGRSCWYCRVATLSHTESYQLIGVY